MESSEHNKQKSYTNWCELKAQGKKIPRRSYHSSIIYQNQ